MRGSRDYSLRRSFFGLRKAFPPAGDSAAPLARYLPAARIGGAPHGARLAGFDAGFLLRSVRCRDGGTGGCHRLSRGRHPVPGAAVAPVAAGRDGELSPDYWRERLYGEETAGSSAAASARRGAVGDVHLGERPVLSSFAAGPGSEVRHPGDRLVAFATSPGLFPASLSGHPACCGSRLPARLRRYASRSSAAGVPGAALVCASLWDLVRWRAFAAIPLIGTA